MAKEKCKECKGTLVLDEENLCAYCELKIGSAPSAENTPSVDCGVCKVLVEEDSEGLFCDVCNTWFHNDCNEMPLHYDLYALLNDAPQNVKWFCDRCIWETEKWITQVNDKKKKSITVKKAKKERNEQFNCEDYENVNVPNAKEQIDTQDLQIPEIKLEINHESEYMECEDTHDAADSDEWIPPEEKEEVVKVKPKKKRKKNISLKAYDESTSKVPEEVVPEDLSNILDISEENLSNFLAEIHTIQKLNKKRSKCTLCSKIFLRLEHCIAHNLKVHKGIVKPHKCPVCKMMFKLKSKRIEHMEKHDDTIKLKCEICDKKLKNHASLKSHLKLFHLDGKFHSCLECDYKSKYETSVTSHMIKTHSFETKFQCTICNNFFASGSRLKEHNQVHKSEKTFECIECGKKFKDAKRRDKHIQIHKSEKTFECIECGKKFKAAKTRDKHTQMEHASVKPFECIECGKKFPAEKFLNEHIKKHEHKVICDICGKILSGKHSLKNHMMMHNDERPLKCEICGKGFRSTGHLNLHIKFHKKIIAASCEICGFGAPTKYRLNIHMKEVHTNETPFECDICGNKYKTKGNLSKHKRGIRGSCKGINLSDSSVLDKREPKTSGMSFNEHDKSKKEVSPIDFQENYNSTAFTSAMKRQENHPALLLYANSHNSNVYLTQYQGNLIPPNSRGITATIQS